MVFQYDFVFLATCCGRLNPGLPVASFTFLDLNRMVGQSLKMLSF
jgi:hypothetical protein